MADVQKSHRNTRAPNKAQCLKWVKECWSSVSTELIQKSPRWMWMPLKMLKSNLKAGKVATLASPAITEANCKLLQEDESDEEDLFASLNKEDEGDLEQNKLLVDTDTDLLTLCSTSLSLHSLPCILRERVRFNLPR